MLSENDFLCLLLYKSDNESAFFNFFSLSKLPSYKGFKGTIEKVMDNQYVNSGEVAIIDSTTIEISELPVKTWTQVSH